MILADSSAWIEYDRATGSAAHLRMRELIDDGRDLAVTEPVVAEVLLGARSDLREQELRSLLATYRILPFDNGHFDGAVRIYRRCRHVGVTPRGLVDCLIAAVAFRWGASLLAHDVDLTRIAEVMGIELDDASLRA